VGVAPPAPAEAPPLPHRSERPDCPDGGVWGETPVVRQRRRPPPQGPPGAGKPSDYAPGLVPPAVQKVDIYTQAGGRRRPSRGDAATEV